MALDAIVTDINTVPEAFRGEYVEKDGKFVLDVTAVDGWDLQDIGGLSNSLRAERNLRNQAERALTPFKGLDPDTARTAVAQIAELEGMTPAEAKAFKLEVENLKKTTPASKVDEAVQARLEAAQAEWEKQLGTQRTEWESQLNAARGSESTLKAQLKTLLVDNQIKAELGKVKLVDGLAPAAEMLLHRSVQVVEKDGQLVPVVVDAAGEARTKIEGASLVPMTVADLVAELKTSTPGLFQPEEKSGVGITPGRPAARTNPDNPWMQGAGFNRTKQAILTNTNPTLAAQLKREAGVA